MDATELDMPKTPWGKRMGIFFAVLLLLLIVAYFVGTSSAFVKGVILPKVGASMNAKITAGDISVSPFSQLYARQLRVETTGSDPLLLAEEVRVRYSLLDILRGNIRVNELTLNSPVINVIQEADGSSNLDPFTKGESKPKAPKKEPTRLSVQNVSIKNGSVHQVQKGKDGSIKTTDLKGLTLDLDRLGNGQTGHLKLASTFSSEQKQGATNDVLGGDLSGGYDISLNQELLPDTLKGALKLNISRADGSFKELAGFNGSLDADLTPKEIRQIALSFSRGNQQLGQLRLSGPMDVERKEGNLRLEINSIDKNVLALATAGKGYDLGNTQVNSTNQITISQNGTFLSSTGILAATSITFSQGALKTPEMNLTFGYQAGVNTAEKTALLQQFEIRGVSGGQEFLRSQLDRQMNLSWGQTVKGYRDAAMNIILTNFNVADWRAVLGTNLSSGIANATLAIVSQQDGKMLNADIRARVDNFSARFGSNRLENAAVTIESTSTIEQLKTISVTRYALTLRQADAPVLQANGTARYQVESKETTAQLTLDGVLPRLLALAALPDAKATAGALKLSVQYGDNDGKKSVVGNLALNDFTGTYGAYSFTNFASGFDYNVDLTPREATINRAALVFAQGFNRGGSIDVKGKYNLENKSGQFNFNVSELNQNTFGPILAPSLGEKRLASIVLNASGEARLDPQGESALKAEVKIANWLVDDREGKLPKTPLAVGLNVDGSMTRQLLELRQFLVQLSPTPRAKNALQLQARLDLGKTNPTPSTLTLSSESFDVTPYYDMFAGSTNQTAQKTGSAAPVNGSAPQTGGEQKEPDAIQLPFKDLTANVKFDRFYLRDVAISNWVGKVTIRSNVVELNPFQLSLNGGPLNVNGKVDVGRPGYGYDLAFKGDAIPLAPLVNSFSSQSNSLQGSLILEGAIRGAGTTGINLRRNLGGNATLNLTNLNYQVVGPKMRRILVPMSIALRVPELTDTPINWVSAQTEIANGVVNLKHLGVESEAFYAESTGTITLADVLTNSTLNLPIDLSLRRSLAQKAGLAQASGATNETKFAKLPRIYTVKGTLGAPDPERNNLALAGIALQGAAGLGLGDGKTEQALGAVGNLLTGQKGGTNGPGTNTTANLVSAVGGLLGGKTTSTNGTAAATNSTAQNLVRGLGGLLANGTSTNKGAANTNAAPTNAVQNALDSLLRPRNKTK